jgi:hypothetical protein
MTIRSVSSATRRFTVRATPDDSVDEFEVHLIGVYVGACVCLRVRVRVRVKIASACVRGTDTTTMRKRNSSCGRQSRP